MIEQRKAVDEQIVALTAQSAVPHHQVVNHITGQENLAVQVGITSLDTPDCLDDGFEHRQVMLLIQDASVLGLHQVGVELRQPNRLVLPRRDVLQQQNVVLDGI
ncbi:hypothetical protein D3C81_1789270 [compost metagenome]